jgi:signal recognition particle GTPase
MAQNNTIQYPLAPPSDDPVESEGSQEVDWKARAEAAESLSQKLEGDLRSERGRRDQRMEEMVDDMGAFRAQLSALANRTASGETELLPGDFAKADQDLATKIATREWDNNFEEALQNLGEALTDDDGEVIVSKEVIASLNKEWQEAQTKQDPHALYRVVSKAGKEARSAIKQKADTDLTEADEAAKAAKKASDSKNGVHDLSVGTPSGSGGGPKSAAHVAKMTNVNDISDEDYAAYVAASS